MSGCGGRGLQIVMDAREGGDDVAAMIGDDSDECCGQAIPIVAYEFICLMGSFEIVVAGNGCDG